MIINKLIKNEIYGSDYLNYYTLRSNEKIIQKLLEQHTYTIHNGCVNTVCWNDNGNYILSGSDDKYLKIYDPFSKRLLYSNHSGHRSNIFCARFLPQSKGEHIISCANDGDIIFTNIGTLQDELKISKFLCHNNKTCYEVRTVSLHEFASCSRDGTVRWYDLRLKEKCDTQYCMDNILIKCNSGVSAIAINPLIPYHVVSSNFDGATEFYDRRMLTVGSLIESDKQSENARGLFASFKSIPKKSKERVTSIEFDDNGNELLVSYQPDAIYLLNWRELSDKKPVEFINESNENPTNKITYCVQAGWKNTGPKSVIKHENNNDEVSPFISTLNNWLQQINTRKRDLDLNNTNESNHNEAINETVNTENYETAFQSSKSETTMKSSVPESCNNAPSPKVKMTFKGHRNIRTIIKKCNFWGSKYVISGSDCGHIYFWNKENGKIVHILEADKCVVNCIQENPLYPILISSGIDYSVKVWEPVRNEPYDTEKLVESIVARNKQFIDESNDRIYIPLQFMLPALRLFGLQQNRSYESNDNE